MSVREHGRLVVVAGAGGVGLRIEREQRLRDGVDGHGAALRECGDERGLVSGGVVARPLVGEEKSGPARKNVRDADGAAERGDAGDGVVGGLGAVETAEGVGPGVERGVVVDDAEAAVVETSGALARVAEALRECELRGGGVVDRSVDEKAVVGRRRLFGRPGRFGLVAGMPGGGLRPSCKPGCWLGFGHDAKLRRRDDLCPGEDLRERKHLKIPADARHGRRNGDGLLDGHEERHLDVDLPDAVGEVREGVAAVVVGDGGEALCAVGDGDGRAGNREVVECDLAVMLRGVEQAEGACQHQGCYSVAHPSTASADHAPHRVPQSLAQSVDVRAE